MTAVRISVLIVCLTCILPATVAAEPGIEIRPDAQGRFEYSDDFSTPRFLTDGFTDNLPAAQWQPGRLTNSGPVSGRTLTYRFFGSTAVKAIQVEVAQRAAGPSLGGHNLLLVSSNGLDWQRAAASGDAPPDAGAWQTQSLGIPAELAKKLAGGTQFWIRIVMNNGSGLKTNVSNVIESVTVRLTVGTDHVVAGDTGAATLEQWSELRKQSAWRSASLDWTDSPSLRAPHYYEDCDGLLCAPGESPLLVPDETQGFLVRRALGHEARLPLALAVFVRSDEADGPLMLSITAWCDRQSSRKARVLWDGKPVASWDLGSYFEKERIFLAEIPGHPGKGLHECRIAGEDSGQILIRRIVVAGAGNPRFEGRPETPSDIPQLLSAEYLPDPEPPAHSQTVEGPGDPANAAQMPQGLQKLYREHEEFGGVRVVLRNAGQHAIRLGDDLLLNGKPIAESYVDFEKDAWDARGVVWYRVRPRLLPPGAVGQVYVRFRKRPSGDGVSLGIPVRGAHRVEVDIPYRKADLAIDYVTTGRSADVLYAYVRRTGKTADIATLTLDGIPLEVSGGPFYGDVAPFCAKLPKALGLGEYHVVGVTDTAGRTVAAQFRVQRFLFPRSSIHVPIGLCKAMHMNLQMWYPASQAECEKEGVYTVAMDPFDAGPRSLFVLGPDEPDAHDNVGGGYGAGLGHHARRLMTVGWQELSQRFAPGAPTWIIMDGTTRPLNWSVYGQLADVSCFDPYPVSQYAADHAYVGESLSLARKCGAPNRMYACLEAYGWSPGQGVPEGNARGPIPAEYRQNVVQAIGQGAKGLTSWAYAGGAGGWQTNEEFTGEITRMNRLIETIEDYLLIGTPVCGVASSDAGKTLTGGVGKEAFSKDRVAVSAVLCGNEALVVTAANHIPASKTTPVIEAAKNVTLSIKVPPSLDAAQAFEVTEDGLVPVRSELDRAVCKIPLDRIESGRVFLLKRP